MNRVSYSANAKYGVKNIMLTDDDGSKVVLSVGGCVYQLDGNRLRIWDENTVLLDVCIAPVFDGEQIQMASWEKAGQNRYQSDLGQFGKAYVSEQFDKLAYWIETPVKQFENVTYLSDGLIGGEFWRTFVSDDYDRQWNKAIDVNIPISSAYAAIASPDGSSDGGMTDPNDIPVHWIWNVHVRAWAMMGCKRWLGISIPGAWGIGVT